MSKPFAPGSARACAGEFRSRVAMQTRQVSDPFGVNPIRRSLGSVLAGLAIVWVPFFISDRAGAIAMLAVGWLAMAMVVLSLPILIWSVAEWLYAIVYRRVYPPIDELPLTQRVINILHRHGLHAIRDISRADDAELLLMSNMEPRDVDDVRRAVSLWRYRRWQDAGFPASGAD